MLMKIREVKHGRLAMLAVAGVYVSTAVTGMSKSYKFGASF